MSVTPTEAPTTIDSLGVESRLFAPSADFSASANIDELALSNLHAEAAVDSVAFWARQAERLEWNRPWDTAHTWSPVAPILDADGAPVVGEDGEPSLSVPRVTWFSGGTLNVAVNCVDRHVANGLGDRVAFHFEGEPGDRETVTYAELQSRVAQAAHALTSLGVGRGDRVVVYMPVLIETVVVTLAIARIGAIHSLVFGGFSAEALRFRVEDTGAKLLVTTDGQFRRGVAVPVKSIVDRAVSGIDALEHVLVVRRTHTPIQDSEWIHGRDVWWHDVVDGSPTSHVPEFFDAETPLFIMYTSGTTGKPKGVVHSSGGYLTQAAWSHWVLFDAKAESDVYWCTADLAWVTAHTYVIYGPLANGVTSVLYEGTPNHPHPARHFEIIDRLGVTTYYTAPTLIRTLMSWFPDGVPAEYSLNSVRLLGTVGESINPEAWMWFHTHVGRGAAPVVDTWWQSESGSAIVAPVPGVTALKPGSATHAIPGVTVAIVDDDGVEVPRGSGGNIVISGTWPSMARTVWGDEARYRDSYWSRFWRQGFFVAGDGAKFDEDGYVWLLGRVDDVINVSGHRLSTIEIESALVAHPDVAEAAVVGVSDPTTGQAIAAFVVPSRHRPTATADDVHEWLRLTAEFDAVLRRHVTDQIGPIARPRDVLVVPDVPKTRSGKIMRRLLVDIAEGRELGDVTSLQDDTVPGRIARIAAAR